MATIPKMPVAKSPTKPSRTPEQQAEHALAKAANQLRPKLIEAIQNRSFGKIKVEFTINSGKLTAGEVLTSRTFLVDDSAE